MSSDMARFERDFLDDLALRERVLNGAQNSSVLERPISAKYQWPAAPPAEAFHGLAGDYVRAIEPSSEADPVALLGQFLAMFGNSIGRGPHFIAEEERHYTNIFLNLVGATSKGRKGSSFARVRHPFQVLEANWVGARIMSGLSSGEGLIWTVRDPIFKHEPIREHRSVTGYQDIEIDPGIADKRLLVFEPEFALVLRVMARETNTLAAIIRQAWESGNLRTLTKNSPAVATGAHISIVGHITLEELRRYITETELASGFANRFLWFCLRRSKCLPDDEDRVCNHATLSALTEKLRRAVAFARTVEEMKRDHEAREDWRDVYSGLSAPKPGLLGAVVSRAEAQVMRLAMIYALLDLSSAIGRRHLEAGLALWQYSEESAKFIFGDALGDPTADSILNALRRNPLGLTRTEISNLFQRNKPAGEVERALGALAQIGAARSVRDESGGRPSERWLAV